VNDAAATISTHAPLAAARAVELVYERRPELAEQYGAIGRYRCRQDAEFHLSFLVAAVAVEDEAVFSDYARWARELLAGYRIPPEHLVDALRSLGDAIAETVPQAADEARRYLDAGCRAVVG
jgi:hypothetical protein